MTWLWLAFGGAVLVAGTVVPVLLRRPRHTGKAAVSARSAYLLLGHHVEVPEPTADPRARALLCSARERWHSAGAVLARARVREDFELAGRIAEEGLAELTEAYSRLGLRGPGKP